MRILHDNTIGKEESMTRGKALDGKPYAGNPHVRFDEGEVAPAATPRRGSLLYRQLGRGTCAYYVTTNDVPEKEQCEIHLISFEAICSFPQLTSGSLLV